MYEDYKNLDLYQTAHRLVLLVYKATKQFPKDELFGIVSQMRRAAVSVVANFAEGYGRKNIKEKIQFYHISLGSLNELEYFINLAHDLEYISIDIYKELINLQLSTAKLFGGYLRGIKRNSTSYQLPATVSQSGQTLLETLVAVSVLVVGIIAGLSMAIYSFSGISTAQTSNIASGLAREGVEVAKMLRDSNWLAGTLSDCGGYVCYADWLTGKYDFPGSAGNGTPYRMEFDPWAFFTTKWRLTPVADYRLRVSATGAYSHSVFGTLTPFYRKVAIIYASTASPYDAISPLVLVRSTVWWTDRRCPNVTDPDLTACKIVSEAYLTNWKNY